MDDVELNMAWDTINFGELSSFLEGKVYFNVTYWVSSLNFK